MNFIIYLLKSEGYDAILVIVYHLTKIKYFIPYYNTYDTKKVSHLYLEYI